MYGYIFEVTNKKTGEKYLGKRYAVAFDKNYFGEENNPALAIAIEKNGRPAFEARMIMPYENPDVLDTVFDSMVKSEKPKVTPKKEETPKVVEPKEEKPVEVKAPAKRGRKKVVEEE